MFYFVTLHDETLILNLYEFLIRRISQNITHGFIVLYIP